MTLPFFSWGTVSCFSRSNIRYIGEGALEMSGVSVNFIPKSWQGKMVNVSVSKLAPGSNVSNLLW